MLNKRQWFKTAAGLLLAPAIVRPESLMVIKTVPTIKPLTIDMIVEAMWKRQPIQGRLYHSLVDANGLFRYNLMTPKLRL
jgi:hypothetical protein